MQGIGYFAPKSFEEVVADCHDLLDCHEVEERDAFSLVLLLLLEVQVDLRHDRPQQRQVLPPVTHLLRES
jgi:hypothetical protein